MNRSEPRRPRRRRKIMAAGVMLSLLTGFLLAAEHDAGARALPQAVVANLAPQAPLTPVAPAVAPPAAPLLAPGATAGQVRAAGRRLAEQGLAESTAIVQLAAAEAPSPVCAPLLASRAQTIAQFNALIAAVPPQLVAVLTAQRNAAVAQIDAVLASFGCPIPSG